MIPVSVSASALEGHRSEIYRFNRKILTASIVVGGSLSVFALSSWTALGFIGVVIASERTLTFSVPLTLADFASSNWTLALDLDIRRLTRVDRLNWYPEEATS